ncbi:hypothetical protein SEA_LITNINMCQUEEN_30 [Gordonia phage LitninMcQueen]
MSNGFKTAVNRLRHGTWVRQWTDDAGLFHFRDEEDREHYFDENGTHRWYDDTGREHVDLTGEQILHLDINMTQGE